MRLDYGCMMLDTTDWRLPYETDNQQPPFSAEEPAKDSGLARRKNPEAMKHEALAVPLVDQGSHVSRCVCPPDFLRAERLRGQRFQLVDYLPKDESNGSK